MSWLFGKSQQKDSSIVSKTDENFKDHQKVEATAAATSTSTTNAVSSNPAFESPLNSVGFSSESVDPTILHPLAGLGQSLDYLLIDDEKLNSLPGAKSALPSRDWSDDLCYGTGTTYLAGKFFLLRNWIFNVNSFTFPKKI